MVGTAATRQSFRLYGHLWEEDSSVRSFSVTPRGLTGPLLAQHMYFSHSQSRNRIQVKCGIQPVGLVRESACKVTANAISRERVSGTGASWRHSFHGEHA